MKKSIFFIILIISLCFITGCGALISAIVQTLFATKVGVVAIPAIISSTGVKQSENMSGMVLLPSEKIPEGYMPAYPAKITIEKGDGTLKETATDPNGYFRVDGIEVGMRRWTAEYNGFTSIEQNVVVSEPSMGRSQITDFKIVPEGNIILSLRKGILVKPQANFFFETFCIDPNGIPFKPDCNWSVNDPNATIDPNTGYFYTEIPGKYTVNAVAKIDNNITSSVNITVLEHTVKVYGKVTMLNNVAVTDATVSIPEAGLFTTTLSDGTYYLPGIPANDTITVMAQARTGFTGAVTVKVPGPDQEIEANINISSQNITPTPAITQIPTVVTTSTPIVFTPTPFETLLPTVIPTQVSAWTIQNSGVSSILRSAHFIDPNNGWIAGEGGIILHTSNGGSEWKSQNSGIAEQLWQIYFFDNSRGFAAGDGGKMLYTLDGGVNWNIRQNPAEPDNIVSIYFSDINNGWAVARNKIINTTTGGIDPNSWNIKNSVTDYIFEDIYFADQSKGWAIDIHDPNKINSLFTNNGGNNWSVNSSFLSSGISISGVGITDISTAWILGDSGKLFKTSDGGISWTMINTNTSETLKGIYFINSTEGWIAGANGTILHTANGGNDWAVIKSPTTASLDIPYFIDGTKGWIVGTGGTILKYLQ